MSPGSKTSRRSTSRARRLGMEPLESRRVLASYTVDSLGDEVDGDFSSGQFTLREALFLANLSAMIADEINFAPALSGEIALNNDHLAITADVIITGPGADRLTVRGDTAAEKRVFRVSGESSSDVTISGLTITGGATNVEGGGFDDGEGGGIFVDFSSLTLDSVVVRGNLATGGAGGGIYAQNSGLTLVNCTIAENGGALYGGGVYIDGDSPRFPSSVVINSTISGNTAFFAGGGVYVADEAALFRNSTIVFNRAADIVLGSAGGVFTSNNTNASTTLYNTIVAGNLRGAGAGSPSDIAGKNVESASANNLIGHSGSSGGITNGTNGNIVGNTLINLPRVLETTLQDNGGPVPTHALVSGSRALDAGSNTFAIDAGGAALTTDSRGAGFARIVDSADADAVATVDIGAYEAQPRTLVVDTTLDESDGDFSTGDFTLREAIERANANAGLDTINFADGVDGNLFVGGEELLVRDSVQIDGPGANVISVDGENQSRVFNIGTDANLNSVKVSISGLTIMHGSVFEASGGGINAPLLGTEVTLRGVFLTRNEADGGSGGAVLVASGKLTIVDSTIHDNAANNGAGVFYGGSGGLIVVNSTFTQNRGKGDGAGLYVFSGSALLRNTTFTQNFANSDEDGGGAGGGLFTTGGFAFTTLHNSLIAGNLAESSSISSDIAGTLEAESSHNLIGDANTAGGLAHGANGNIVGNSGTGTIDPSSVLELILADNGGQTLTHKLVPNSPALDAGSNTLARNQNGGVLAADQRGRPRIKDYNASGGPKVDIGAVEMQPPLMSVGVSTTYTENNPARVLASAALFDGRDARPGFEMGTLRVSNVFAPHADDRLAVRNQGTGPGQIGVSGSTITFEGLAIGTFTGGAGPVPLVITLKADAEEANVQALLRNITFRSLSDDPPTTARTIRFRMTDGAGAVSNIATKTVNITAVNDAPLIAPAEGNTVDYQQNTAPTALLANALVTDPDTAIFEGGRLLVRIISGGSASNRLLLDGAFEFEGDLVKRKTDGLVIGRRNAGGGEGTTRLEITFDQNATRGLVQQVVRGIRFRTLGGTSTVQRIVEFSLTDGDLGASNRVNVTVNVS